MKESKVASNSIVSIQVAIEVHKEK
jgi:hypothetical protein